MSPRTPYWWAFLKHPVNQAIALGALATSLLLSLPWGGDGFGLGMLALAAIEMVGLATVPGLAVFQAHVDKQDRFAARQARRERLLREIEANGGSVHLRSYEQMRARVATLMARQASVAPRSRSVRSNSSTTSRWATCRCVSVTR